MLKESIRGWFPPIKKKKKKKEKKEKKKNNNNNIKDSMKTNHKELQLLCVYLAQS